MNCGPWPRFPQSRAQFVTEVEIESNLKRSHQFTLFA